jgi:uncharacterized protein (TIGR00255 family)
MTGYGEHTEKEGATTISVSIKSVNSRYLDLTINLPPSFCRIEKEVGTILRKEIERGKVYVNITVECPDSDIATITVDYGQLDRLFTIAGEIEERYRKSVTPAFSDFFVIPGLLKMSEKTSIDDELRSQILTAVRHATAKLRESRKNESEAVIKDFRVSINEVQDLLKRIEREVPRKIKNATDAFHQKIESLHRSNAVVDPQRVAGEVALLLDKLDVSEEIDRLKSHIRQIRKSIRKGGPVGKKLQFYIQEMNREANTIGAKSNSARISDYVVEIKTHLEKLREHAQNLE